MRLDLHRKTRTETATLGELFVDGVFECYVLEDPVRLDDPATPQDEGKKIYGRTAIPAGTYRVVVNWSPHFQKFRPRLLEVPGFDGILIHAGNTPADTKGCLLLGKALLPNGTIKPGTSTPAFNAFFVKLTDALNKDERAEITITNDFVEASH